MRKLFILLFVLIVISSCTDVDSATKVIKSAGYHPIEIGGYSWLSCSDDDFYQTKFKAYSADSSMIVTGCVCEGFWFKGSTIRLD